MKKLNFLKVTGVVFLVLVIVILGFMLFESQKEVVAKKTPKEENALETKVDVTDSNKSYYSEVEKLNTNTFIDEKVNTYIDELFTKFIEENKKENWLPKYKRAVFTNTIDSFKVNDSIYGIRITTNIKKVKEENYTTVIKTFNVNMNTKNDVLLSDLYNSGFEEIIGSYDAYLLKQTSFVLYDEIGYARETKYSDLTDYVRKDVLSAENLQMTKEEYDKLFASSIDPNRKMVAITFDDGPNPTNTPKILESLAKNGAHATFFMVGQNVSAYPDTVKQVFDAGNEIGIHTWNHANLTKISADKILKEVEDTSNAIENITHVKPKLIRPPYGAINSTVKSTLSSYPLILWNIDSLDWKSRDENKFVPLVLNDVEDGDIILLHDIHSTTVPGADKIISSLTSQGYQLVTVSQMLEAKGYDTTKTHVFYSGRQ